MHRAHERTLGTCHHESTVLRGMVHGSLVGRHMSCRDFLDLGYQGDSRDNSTSLSYQRCHTANSKVQRWAMNVLRGLEVEGWDPQNCLPSTP